MKTIRSKGRPKGSEKDDSKTLTAIADLILANPKLKPTTAMRRCNPKAGDADIRRWQGKWKERRTALLAEAKKRTEEDAQQKVARIAADFTNTPAFWGASERLRMMHSIDNSPFAEAMRRLQDSPTMRLLKQLQDSSIHKFMREMENSPTARLMRENKRIMEAMSNLPKFR